MDFGLPVDTPLAHRLIAEAFDRARSGQLVEVGCAAGNGRTGCIIACMAILTGTPADEAVEWTRSHYCLHSIDTSEQERWVEAFPGRKRLMTPRSPGDPIPEGHVGAVDQDGKLWMLDVSVAMEVKPSTVLTSEQIARIEAFKEILAEHETTSLQHALANFGRDRTPEREIRIWERIARVYEAEVRARPQVNEVERKLLYRVIFACSFDAGMENVLSMVPAAKSLPELDRVVERYGAPGS
ncbi:MAG: hypothetical protein ABI595_14290 [Actinomycetota bacterium]